MSKSLFSAYFDSPRGQMIAVADNAALYLLEFVQRKGLEPEIERLKKRLGSEIVAGRTALIDQVEHEINAYFAGELQHFTVPFVLTGSPFQQSVWQALCTIPAGQTRSYQEIALQIGRPTASRAVARANSTNQLAVVVPCHRVINANGQLGGYAGGIATKQWLLQHEKSMCKQ
jgi:AraC family transcriptional regulator of adaptative response/methylated-DNA-[protein]-cysteine methyltransferase